MHMFRYLTALVAVAVLIGPGLNQSEASSHKAGEGLAQKNMKTYYINDPYGRNVVTIISEAPLEDMTGTSNQITGQIMVDPNNIESAHGHFTVPVKSIDTGIPLRNEHMMGEQWMNAEEYPNVKFEFDKAKNVKETKSSDEFQTYELTLVGKITMRGETKQIEVPGTATFMKESEKTQKRLPGNLLAARTEFDVKLSEFGIQHEVIGAKVGENLTIKVSFVGSDEKPEEQED